MTDSKHTPGPWKVGYRAIDVGCENAKIGGYTKLFDVRGWGYLTGNGHGGLNLPTEEAFEIQKASAHLIAAAPDLLDALKTFVTEYVALVESGDAGHWDAEKETKVIAARAAIAKAEGKI